MSAHPRQKNDHTGRLWKHLIATILMFHVRQRPLEAEVIITAGKAAVRQSRIVQTESEIQPWVMISYDISTSFSSVSSSTEVTYKPWAHNIVPPVSATPQRFTGSRPIQPVRYENVRIIFLSRKTNVSTYVVLWNHWNEKVETWLSKLSHV